MFDDGTATDGASGRQTLSAVSLSGRVRVCVKKCRAKPASLRFKLSASVAGMKLRTGRWRLTLAVARSHRSVHFTVRRGH